MKLSKIPLTVLLAACAASGGTALADPVVPNSTVTTPTPSTVSAGGAFSASKAIALNKLSGTVTSISVQNLGNVATATGSGNGGGSAAGGTGNGGSGTGGSGGGAGGSGGSGSGSGGSASGSANGQGNGASGSGGGTGGAGAAGGSVSVNSGTFNMSNTMTGTATSAAGIVVVSQNTGIGALTQQSVNVQASLGTGVK